VRTFGWSIASTASNRPTKNPPAKSQAGFRTNAALAGFVTRPQAGTQIGADLTIRSCATSIKLSVGKAIKFEEVYLHADEVESAGKEPLTQPIRSHNSWRSHTTLDRQVLTRHTSNSCAHANHFEQNHEQHPQA
jgi:hypothetical protein